MTTRTTRFVPDAIDEDDRPYLKSPFEFEETAQAGQLIVTINELRRASQTIRAGSAKQVRSTALDLDEPPE